MTILIFVAVAVALFVAGARYGAVAQAKAVAEYLKVRASFTTEAGKMYAAIVADIKGTLFSTLFSAVARVKKAL